MDTSVFQFLLAALLVTQKEGNSEVITMMFYGLWKVKGMAIASDEPYVPVGLAELHR